MEANGPGNAFALLKQAGFLPKPGRFLPVSIDGDEALYLWSLACLSFVDEQGMNHHLDPVRQIIHAALQRIQSEDPACTRKSAGGCPCCTWAAAPRRRRRPSASWNTPPATTSSWNSPTCPWRRTAPSCARSPPRASKGSTCGASATCTRRR